MFSLSREIEYWNGLGCQNSCWDEHFGKSVYMSSLGNQNGYKSAETEY